MSLHSIYRLTSREMNYLAISLYYSVSWNTNIRIVKIIDIRINPNLDTTAAKNEETA